MSARRARLARSALVPLAGLVLIVAIGVATLAGGSSRSFLDVLRTLVGLGSSADALIILQLTLPRVLGAALVGACLGLAGALTQTFARNPLATPDILGVTSGAGLGAVAGIVAVGGSFSVTQALLSIGLPALAMVGAIVTAAVVYGLAWKGGIESYRIILIGIGVTATAGGITSYLVARAELWEAAAAAQWLVGSLSGMSWSSVWPPLVALVVVTPIALLQSRSLAVSVLGDELSTGLGVTLQRHRLLVIACAVVLTACAVSASGPVEFVAFVAPQLALRLVGGARPPLLASAVAGSLIVVAGDALVRSVLPGEVPVGIITALVGGPYLIWLLIRGRGREA